MKTLPLPPPTEDHGAGRRWPRVSVVAYVFVSFGVCIAAMGAILATTTASSFARERRQASTQLRAAAQYNADVEEDALGQVSDVLGGLAEQESIQSLDPARCRSAFEGLESVADQGSLYVLRPDRTSVCELLARRRPVVDIPAGSWFADAQEFGEVAYGGVRLDAAGVPQLIFAVPIETSAGVGVLAAVLDAAVPPLEVPPSTPSKTVIVELDGARRTVVSTSEHAPVKPGRLAADSWMRRPLAGKHVHKDADGVTRIYEEVRVEGLDRVVLAGVARSIALQAAKAERTRNLELAAAILVLVASLGVVVQRRIARPIARLRAAIRDAGDDGSVQAEITGPSEIAALADEFNATMVKRRDLELDLAASVARAEDASRMKSLFLANVSHEIRTPMNGVLGMIGLLRDDELTETQRDYLDTMDDSASALMAIINDLLDFSKIEAGMVEIDDVAYPLRGCLRSAVAPWVPVAKSKSVALSVQADPSLPEAVMGDPTRVRQVVSNLVDNAVKFTSHGEVVVRVAPAADGRMRIEVSDTGIGIKDQTGDQLFEAFVQGDPSTTRRFGGTGLGLAICKQLVTLMHGEIDAKAREGGGSVFWFELPLIEADAADVAERREVAVEPRDRDRGTVLLAEDNPVNQKVARALVEQLGFDVDVASNGREAVARVRSGSYVAVLMDLQMPEMDGFEATAAIRNELHSSIPVIALSASVLPEDRSRCDEAGMNGHLAKPIDRAALRDVLDAAATASL